MSEMKNKMKLFELTTVCSQLKILALDGKVRQTFLSAGWQNLRRQECLRHLYSYA